MMATIKFLQYIVKKIISCEVALQRLYRKKRYTNNLELNWLPRHYGTFLSNLLSLSQKEGYAGSLSFLGLSTLE